MPRLGTILSISAAANGTGMSGGGGGGGGGLPVTTDLWGHWDAAEGITKDGSNLISQWEDQSGNGNHWEQSTGSDQPLFVADAGADLNNLPAVSFAGTYLSPDWMYLTGTGTTFYESGDSGAYTIFFVFTDMDATPSNLGGVIQGQYDRSPSTDPTYANFMIYKVNGNGATRYLGWSTVAHLGNMSHNGPHIGDANPRIIGITCHGSFNAGTPESWGANIDNGTETCYPTLCQGYAATSTVVASDYLYLNKQLGYIVPNGLVYKLAEMVLYKGALSNADFNTMETYLNTKYAVY